MNTTNEIGYSPGQMLTIVSNALLQAKEAKTFKNNLIEATVSELGQATLCIKECVKYNPMVLAIVLNDEFPQYDCEFKEEQTIIMTPRGCGFWFLSGSLVICQGSFFVLAFFLYEKRAGTQPALSKKKYENLNNKATTICVSIHTHMMIPSIGIHGYQRT